MGLTGSSPLLFTPLMISMVGIMATALALTTYHLMVSKFCAHRDDATTAQPYHARNIAATVVDRKVLNSIPIQAYTHKQRDLHGVDQSECAVRLGEFEEGAPVRLLPHCHHVFHLQCIGERFISHSICPRCRSPVVTPTSPALPVIIHTSGKDAAYLPHQFQSQGSLAISIDDDCVLSARRSSRASLHRSSSLSVERKPQFAFAPIKRSLSDCSYVSIEIHAFEA